MIEIPQPSIALNAIDTTKNKEYDVPGTTYDMWKTWNVPANTSSTTLMSQIASMAKAASGKLKCLVINCHGDYNYGTNIFGKEKKIMTGGFGFSIGQGINYYNADLFSQIRDLFRCIIIVACGASAVTNPKSSEGDGVVLCSRIARAANSYVIAPRIMQAATHLKLPKNHIDNFEGEVVRFNRAGQIDDYRFLGRKLIKEIF